MTTAPIALFVYNRPAHTRQTVEALLKNELAGESDLFIFSDAPKTPEAEEAVREVREYIRTISGFRSVSIVEREKNWGLANSIIDGVTALVNTRGRVIVLEDDLITSPHFLRFMNDALELYERQEQVMHISGGTYPVEWEGEESTYFLHLPLCWGWATWQRAWQAFRKDVSVMDQFDQAMISRFDFDNTASFWRQLELNREGKINTWFVFWYATLFIKNGLALFPKMPLVKNIGFDGSGVHCGKTSQFEVSLGPEPVDLGSIDVQESSMAYEYHKRFFSHAHPNLARRIYQKISRLIGALKA